MIHLWKVIDDNIILNATEIYKDPVLCKVLQNDKSIGKLHAHTTFRYIDMICNQSGFCKSNGLSKEEARVYVSKNCIFPQGYEIPKNIEKLISYVEDNIEHDYILTSIRTAIKALKIATSSIEAYMEELQTLKGGNFKDADGNRVDVYSIITKLLASVANVPKDIKALQKLQEEALANVGTIRGGEEYSKSMDGDESASELGIIDDIE